MRSERAEIMVGAAPVIIGGPCCGREHKEHRSRRCSVLRPHHDEMMLNEAFAVAPLTNGHDSIEPGSRVCRYLPPMQHRPVAAVHITSRGCRREFASQSVRAGSEFGLVPV